MRHDDSGTNGHGSRTQPIRVIIVEDDPFGRELIANLLDGREDAELLATFGHGRPALDAIEAERPDLLFFAIERPEPNGFDLLEHIALGRPQLIIVSTDEQHALRAFDHEAVDFLLKPFTRQRFDAAFARAARRVRRERSEGLIRQLAELSHLGNGTAAVEATPITAHAEPDGDAERLRAPLQKLVVRDGPNKVLIDVREIDWIEAADYYATIHVGTRAHLVRRSLNWLESHLDPRRFARIHRSSIVNMDRVREIRPWSGGSHDVLLHDGTELRLSASRRRELEYLLGQSL